MDAIYLKDITLIITEYFVQLTLVVHFTACNLTSSEREGAVTVTAEDFY